MVIARTLRQLDRFRARARGPVGFVPTMGDLHEGHLSLLRRCRRENGAAVLSVFVNPIQFDRRDDFQKYHRDEKRDFALARREGVDCVWAPSAEEMYPAGFQTEARVRELSKPLCGTRRPGHFDGVATVVLKLFNQVRPDRAYFGMKDYQQFRIIERMVRDLDLRVKIVPCPIVREADGLAMSSRNRRLDSDERRRAARIRFALQSAGEMLESRQRSSKGELSRKFRDALAPERGDRVEYFEAVDPQTLQPRQPLKRPVLLAAAVWIGGTRLIDNLLLP